jgi:hypothetical protein
MIRGEQPRRNPVENLHKAFFFLVHVLKGLGIVFMDLIGNKITPSTRVNFSLFFKIGTGQTRRQLLKKIFPDIIGTMRFGNQPALGGLLAMHWTQHFGTGQKRPALLLLGFAFAFKRQVNEMIF